MATKESNPQIRKDPDQFLRRSVQDLISLEGRTIVITGGARGLGLAFGFAVTEVGGNVAIVDATDKPHEHFQILTERSDVKVKFYQ
jgi:short-subunit dehydrogenase